MQPEQSQSRPSSGRVLKPSQQQQTRNASPSRSSTTSTTKPKPAASALVSVLTRDRLQSNLKYYQFLTRVQHLLIETDAVTAATLQRALLVLRPVDYEEVTQERSNDGRCGWPACSNDVQQASRAKGRYRLSLRQHKVWEVEEGGGRRYCSERCEEASAEYAVQLKEEPLYMRRLGDMMTAMQQDEQKQQPHNDTQQQQSTQQLLASLPAYTASHSTYDALRHALPPNADTAGLVIKENSDESAQPVVSGQSAAMEGYNQQQQPPSQQRNLQPTSPSSPSTVRGKLGSASACLRTAPHLPSAARTVTIDTAPLQSKQPPPLSDNESKAEKEEEEEELLDSIARTAINEKTKLHQRLNATSDNSRASTTTKQSCGEEDNDNELQSADEAKQNIAAMRQAKPLSPFAQLAGLLTHYVTDDTIALLRSGGRTDVTPAGSELVRRRQEALLGWLHGELRVVCGELAVHSTRAVQNSVDSVVLTFLLNEAVPALPSRLWQVVVTVVLVALHRSSGGATVDMDEQVASKFVESRGFTELQLAALLDIILPTTAASKHLDNSPAPPQPASTDTTTAITANDSSTSTLSTARASLLSVPRYLLSSTLSFLDSSDLSAASLVCSHFRLLCHPLTQHSDERTLLAHNNSLTATRMATMGYREGVQEGREVLMQAGFDAGVMEGWSSGRTDVWRKGVVGALSMWNEKQAGQAASNAVSWSVADVEWLWRQCERVNSAVMRRPRERGGRGTIAASTVADEDEKATACGNAEWDERCVRLVEQCGANGRQLFDRLKAEMEGGKKGQPSENGTDAEEREVDARIAAQMGDEIGSNDSAIGGLSGPQTIAAHNSDAAADDFM